MRKYSISGKIVDLEKQIIFPGTIQVQDGIIISVEQDENTNDQFILPGFVDAHVHVESSMIIPSEFARLAVTHGTVATVSDPHEIGNVLGIEGVKYMMENGKKTPFKFYFGAPSCVPATIHETAGSAIGVKEVEELLKMDDIVYLAEMMNFPGVLFNDPEVMEKIRLTHHYKKVVDGHAPGLRGDDAKKYIEAGISTDHECFTAEEALDKLKYGMKIIIREGSAAKNFEALIDLMNDHADMMMFGSDDKHPNDLVRGHINLLIKRALKKKIDLMKVLRASSYNAIKHYGMNVGLLQKGDDADFVVVDNFEQLNILQTYIKGEMLAEKGQSNIKSVNAEIVNNFNCKKISINDIQIQTGTGKIKVIEVMDGQLITNSGSAVLNDKNGFLVSDTQQDVLKMVVVNRYFSAAPAICFVKNFGIQKGALASSVAHDSHNIIALGVSDEDIVNAINLVIEHTGGVSASCGEFGDILPLPVAGLMSADDGYKVAEKYESLDLKVKEWDCKLQSPYMTLSFLALLVIPELKLSDKGLFDGKSFQFTSLYM